MMARKASEFSLKNVDPSLIWKQMDIFGEGIRGRSLNGFLDCL